MQSLETVAKALNDNQPRRAALALVHAQFPPLPDAEAPSVQRMTQADRLAKINLSYLLQPRIPAGQEGAGEFTAGAGSGSARNPARLTPVANVPINEDQRAEEKEHEALGEGPTAAAQNQGVLSPGAMTPLPTISPAAGAGIGVGAGDVVAPGGKLIGTQNPGSSQCQYS